MNWTGGRLQQHSTCNRNGAARQKQHFAKVQQKLRGGNKKSPIKFSIFNHIVEDRQYQSRRRESSVVESSGSRHSNRGYSVPGESLQPTKNHLPPQQDTKHESQATQHQYDPPVVSKQRETSMIEADLNEELYDASPPSRPRVKRGLSVDLPMAKHFEALDESLSEKRRRLLRKGDWVGVGIQKPARVTSRAPTPEQNVGRRRKLTDGNRARYQSRQTHIVSPFPKRRQINSHLMGSPRSGLQKTDVMISIGGRVVPPGVSSSSIGGRGTGRQDSHRRSFTESSDMMLLGDGRGMAVDGGHDNGGNMLDTTMTHVARTQTPFISHRTGSMAHSRSDLSILLQQIPGNILQGGKDHGTDSSLRHEQVTKQSPVPSSTKDRNSGNTRFAEEEVFVVSSHPSSIYQPVPTSSRISKFLHSHLSDNFGSTIGQIGEIEPAVSRGQMLDNNVWESWANLNTTFDEEQKEFVPYDDQAGGEYALISPGISAIHVARGGEYLVRHCIQSSPLESPDTDEEDFTPTDTEIATDTDQFHVHITHLHSKSKVDGARILSPPRDTQLTTGFGESRLASRELSVDPDELWRKFVFGSSSEELESQLQLWPPKQITNQRIKNTNSSTVGDVGTEISFGSPEYPPIPSTTTSQLSSHFLGQENDGVVTKAVSMRTKNGLKRRKQAWGERGTSSTYATRGSSVATEAVSSDHLKPIDMSLSLGNNSLPLASVASDSRRKVLFTKPEPFTGRKSIIRTEEKPLHIGWTLRERLEGLEPKEAKRKNLLYEHDLYDSDEDIESIGDE